MNKLKLLSYLFLSTAIIISYSSCKNEKKDEPQEEKTEKGLIKLTPGQMASITIDTAKLEAEEAELSLIGEVSFDEDKIEKVFPLVGGNVIKVNVTLGDFVKKGAVLAVIKSPDIGEVQSQYNVALNNLEVAQKNVDIANELYKTNVNSQVQLMSAQNEFNRATSEASKLKQALSIYGASEKGGDAVYNVLAPIEGYVVEKNINENMQVRSDNNANLFTVSALNTIWVLADVYESDLSKVKVNDDVDITTIAYPDKVFKGTIKRIGNVLDPQSKVVKARIELDNSEGLLKPEMFASVKVHLKQTDKLVTVKSNAIIFSNGNNYVMVYKNKTSFEKRQVIVEHSYKNKTYIKIGLFEKELVVGNGSLYVANAE